METPKQHNDSEQPDEELVTPEPPPKAAGVVATFRNAFRQAKERREREGPRSESARARAELSRDKTKTLFAMTAAIVALLIVFLGLFSSSHEQVQRDQAARRGKPNLGRPGSADVVRPHGSVTPMLNAETAGQDPPSDEVTPDDVNNTSRQNDPGIRASSDSRSAAQVRRVRSRSDGAETLGSIPFSDPALEAYRRQLIARSASVQQSAPTPPERTSASEGVPVQRAVAHDSPLAKSSLVFVSAPHANVQKRSTGRDSRVPIDDSPAMDLELPSGTRLMARLQTAVSSAVKAPVVAVIETHYERDGMIVVPAGSRVIGELQGASRNGIVNIRFQELRLPDGGNLKLEAGAMSLTFGPLKGQVLGTNRGKRFLARALTGVGTVAAFSVGRPGGSALSGPLDNSIFLRERVAQNIGIAGEQELMNLAFTQDIVVTVPGNTRFFIVLHQNTKGGVRSEPITPNVASRSPGGDVPTAGELRELMSLRQEIRRLSALADNTSVGRTDNR